MNPADLFQPALKALGQALGGQLGLVLLGGLGLLALALLLRGFGRAADAFPYVRAGALFTPAEAIFLHALHSAVGPELLVFGKVRLADLLQPREGLPRQRFFQALNRITGKHADFVLCDRDTLQPLVAIELDDRSHARADRQARDRFVEGAFAAAGLPLLRYAVQRNGRYPTREIQAKLAGVLPADHGQKKAA